MGHRKVVIIPKTLAGKCAVGLSIVFIVLIGAKIQYSLQAPTFAIAALGLAGFIGSIVAIFKNKDKAILNFLAIIVGAVIILWFAAELIFPH
jgi:hypothetical protein